MCCRGSAKNGFFRTRRLRTRKLSALRTVRAGRPVALIISFWVSDDSISRILRTKRAEGGASLAAIPESMDFGIFVRLPGDANESLLSLASSAGNFDLWHDKDSETFSRVWLSTTTSHGAAELIPKISILESSPTTIGFVSAIEFMGVMSNAF